jgi:cephalosporin hydroxylase
METGTAEGGSGLFLATLCEAKGTGEVISVDIEARPGRPHHDRLTYITGSSTHQAVIERLTRRASEAETVLVVLDSDHSYDHVLAELRAYAPLVTPGSYLVVEDTNINGHTRSTSISVPARWRPWRISSRRTTPSRSTSPERSCCSPSTHGAGSESFADAGSPSP